MKDFDFEELDKAVTSLAANTPKDQETLKSSSVNNQPTKSTSIPLSNVDDSPKPRPATPLVRPTQVDIARPARPRRGAFMDIVPANPPKPVKRVGTTIQPVSAPEEIVAKVPSEQAAPEVTKPQESPALQESSINTKEGPQSQSEPPQQPEVRKSSDEVKDSKRDVQWPDPLDFHDIDSVVAKQPDEKPGNTSPFLAEAKVEKRPLGAFSNFKPSSDPPSPRGESAVEAAPPVGELGVDELTPQKDRTFKEPDVPVEQAEEPKDNKSTKENEIDQSVSDGDEKVTGVESEITTASPQTDTHAKAMMSIPQQYRTEHKSTDKAPRPVFDTKEYHPPLLEAAVTEHHASVWTKLFIALVALVLLGAGGYFVYLFMFTKP